MPKYLFRLTTGEQELSRQELELAGIDAVRVEALRRASTQLRADEVAGDTDGTWQLMVTDPGGAQVLALTFSIAAS